MIYTISVVQGCKVSKIDERKLKREKGRTGKDELYSSICRDKINIQMASISLESRSGKTKADPDLRRRAELR